MGKENKKSDSTVDEGLQTLKKTVKVNTVDTTKTESIKKETEKDTQKGQVKSVKNTIPFMTPPPPIIEEKDLIQEPSYTQTIVHKIEEPVVELVYEITFIEVHGQNKIDRTVYTKDVPVFKTKNILFVSNLFGRENLKEIVLKKKEIKTSCKKPLEQTEFELDLRNGVLLKVIPEQPWMNSDYESTKKIFDEMVLKAYRDLSSSNVSSEGQQTSKVKKGEVDMSTGRPKIKDL